MVIHTTSAVAAGTMWLPAPGYSPPSSDGGSYASGGESSLGGSVASHPLLRTKKVCVKGGCDIPRDDTLSGDLQVGAMPKGVTFKGL